MFRNCMILAVLVFLLGLPQLSQAMCAYNRSQEVMEVDLNCGSFCENTWLLNQNDKECRPDKGGEVYYQYYKNEGYRKAHVRVDEHGWTTTRGHGDELELCSKWKNGNIRECMRFKHSILDE